MAIDERHEIDTATGFVVDKKTGIPIGLMSQPHLPVSLETDFPKWVIPDASHIVRKQVDGAPDHVSTPGFAEFHINRLDGVVTVLVKDAEEEAKALAAREEPKAAEVDSADVGEKSEASANKTADLPT